MQISYVTTCCRRGPWNRSHRRLCISVNAWYQTQVFPGAVSLLSPQLPLVPENDFLTPEFSFLI